jgi:hypothetical protein
MTDEQAIALNELRHLTTCHCQPPWTDRGLHETHCAAEYREDVETLARAIGAPSPQEPA